MTSGAWTKSSLTALTAGQIVKAYATASGKCISAVSNSVTVPLVVGASYQGGKVAYIFVSGDPGYVSGQTHGLIAAISDNAASKWGHSGTFSHTGTALGTGYVNTTNILFYDNTDGSAARLCRALEDGGYSDWYLPSKDELYKLYLNRAAIGNFNTSLTGLYWSSSEDPASSDHWNSSFYHFSDGTLEAKDKDELYLSRAVRSF